jgi:hypothetical protein
VSRVRTASAVHSFGSPFTSYKPSRTCLRTKSFAEIEREVAKRRHAAIASHMPETAIAAISVERVARERTEECAKNALHVGIMQHSGALIVVDVVESREPLHV